ncbi:ubiquitin carboxyl-terminal hydrolase [Striga asiatica]|uniref:Ubiquitin carboxyl-terminal hydrolase n=1 Tax=Striga asiatica TaxID=4170 RepID=A0A5A7Q8Z9_STRAF|nr:ubiquitin carboxyl-terminal hydrolase [Striga asiatica]
MGPTAFPLLFFFLFLQARYFEVTRPIPHPKTKPCSYLVLQHQFAFTYGKPLVKNSSTDAQEFLNYLLNELVNILEKEARATKSDQERKEQRLERGVYRGYRIAAIEGRYSHRVLNILGA